ncbi:MAG: hypothetical protein U5L08_15145 [Xanthomonadales bacterium]|nr:hypothetical protein [Xanthomonadales bacterium]
MILVVSLAASVSAWAQPVGYAINSRGNFQDSSKVFALWRIDLATGAETYIGWTGRGDFIDIEGIAFDSEGRLYGADDSEDTLLRIGTETGNAIPVGGSVRNMGISTDISMDFGMTFTCEGQLLVSSAGEESLYIADTETGALESVGSLGAPIVDMATIGSTIYGIGLGTDGDGNQLAPNLYRIDMTAPAAELIGPLGNGASPYNQAGLAADESGRLWAITDRNRVANNSSSELPSEILRIDPASGAATRVAETIVGIESLAITPPGECSRGTPQQALAVSALSIPALWLLALVVLAVATAPLRRLTAS